jgi:hypothetical protein
MNRFFDVNEINPNLNLLKERFDDIQKEFMQNKDKLFFINWGAEIGYYVRENNAAYKGWKVAPLYGNIMDILSVNTNIQQYNHLIEIEDDLLKVKYNTSLLPILTSTLLESGVRKRVGITGLEPGKEIKWHTDPDPENPGLAIIRGLWGLDVPEEEEKESAIYLNTRDQKIKFKNNEYAFFWGRTKHKVKNNLSNSRYMICFDHEIPYKNLLNS